ncbi:MAG: Holliday junction resolvase RuvX [Firmicutes bacterium]|nr:Holliday junction resolvase RuvX [Bacillota bacterium]
MRKIGLDVGDKTVGIAVSDPLGITAQGLMTLERVGIRKDTGKILDLVKEYECDTIVIGLNKRLDGTESIQTEKVYEFRTMLENKMRSTGIKGVEVVWQDERLTTVMAERVLIEADLSRKKRKEVIDKQAAVLILQSYLDKLAYENRKSE